MRNQLGFGAVRAVTINTRLFITALLFSPALAHANWPVKPLVKTVYHPVGLEAADIDNDGDLDFVTGSEYDDTLYAFHGRNGRMGPP